MARTLPNLRILFTVCSAFLLSTLMYGCLGSIHYMKAKQAYAEARYEAALHEVEKAVSYSPDSISYHSLRQRIHSIYYSSRGLPLIAYLSLSAENSLRMSALDYLEYHRRMERFLREVKEKFTLPIALSIDDSIPALEKQIIRSVFADILSEISTDAYPRFILIDKESHTLPSLSFSFSIHDLTETVRVDGPKTVRSKYQLGVEKILNEEYLVQQARLKNFRKRYAYILQEHNRKVSKREFDAVEDYLLEKRKTIYDLKQAAKDIQETLEKLNTVPAYTENRLMEDYEFVETECQVCLDINFSFRITDLEYERIWMELKTAREKCLTLVTRENIHPDDINGFENEAVTDQDILEVVSKLKKEMSTDALSTIKGEISKVFYHRGRQLETNGRLLEAWENFYLFSLVCQESQEECGSAKSFVLQHPLGLGIQVDKGLTAANKAQRLISQPVQ